MADKDKSSSVIRRLTARHSLSAAEIWLELFIKLSTTERWTQRRRSSNLIVTMNLWFFLFSGGNLVQPVQPGKGMIILHSQIKCMIQENRKDLPLLIHIHHVCVFVWMLNDLHGDTVRRYSVWTLGGIKWSTSERSESRRFTPHYQQVATFGLLSKALNP